MSTVKDKERKEGALGDKFASFSNHLRGCQNSSKSIVIYLICSNYIYCEDKERKEGALGDKFASFSNHSSEGKLTQFDLALAKAHSLSGVSGCKIFDFLQHRCNSFL